MRILLVALILACTQDSSENALRGALASAVHVDVEAGRYLSVRIDTLASSHPLALFVNGQHDSLEYLLLNVLPPQQLFGGVSGLPTDSARAVQLVNNLLDDSVARSTLMAYMRAASGDRAGSLAPVSEVNALHIAARFFHPASINGDTIRVYRCVGITGIAGLGEQRHFAFEAFAYATLRAADTDPWLNADFSSAVARVRAIGKEADAPEARLARAQADMYSSMQRSEALKAALRTAYRGSRDRLPFRVPDWDGIDR